MMHYPVVIEEGGEATAFGIFSDSALDLALSVQRGAQESCGRNGVG
jgi:hypothetical protein